jgi:uncharacterized protein YjbI with pentapeptide repeats
VVDWNNWANEVRQLWVQLIDIGDVATAAIGRIATLARVLFDEDLESEANFANFLFPGDVLFAGVKFARGGVFTKANFHGRVSFVAPAEGDKVDGCEFGGAAKLYDAVFLRDADFSQVRFAPTAIFDGAQFHQKATFDDAQFNPPELATHHLRAANGIETVDSALDNESEPTDGRNVAP